MWQPPAKPSPLTQTHTHTHTHTIPARSSTCQAPLSPPDLQCLGQAGSLPLSLLSCASLRGLEHLYALCFTAGAIAESTNQIFLSPQPEGLRTVCELFLTWSISGCLQHQSGPPSPAPSDVEKGPEASGPQDQDWPGGSRPSLLGQNPDCRPGELSTFLCWKIFKRYRYRRDDCYRRLQVGPLI